MRFSDRITLVFEADSYYDPIEGRYVPEEIIKKTRACKLSTMGLDRTNELFGQIDKVITIARLQRPYLGKIDYVYLNGDESRKYEVKRQSNYRKGVLFLEGVS